MNTAIIFDIERCSYVDGPGIRTTVFFKGCNLRCAWCHNPESQSRCTELLFYKNKCIGCGKCIEKCPTKQASCTLCGTCTIYCPQDAREVCGRSYTLDELMTQISKDDSFYRSSGGGVTFSGGECMLRIDFLTSILKRAKEADIHTAVDTAGCVPYESFEKILLFTDLFLYDLKCMDSEKHKEYTGVENALILDNLKRLLKTGKEIWVRIPIIPTFNDTEEEMEQIRSFFEQFGSPSRIDLLPYHAMGEHKYEALDKPPPAFKVPEKQWIDHLKTILLRK